MNKRSFLKLAGLASAGVWLPSASMAASVSEPLSSMLEGVSPITNEERRQRIAKAQTLMAEHDVQAIVLEPGAAMDYFSGIQWWRSERLTCVVIPQKGEIAVVCPFFEEPSIRESLKVGEDVRVWQEHENPFELVVQILRDRAVARGKIGFESSVRYFVSSGILALNKKLTQVSAEPITRGCRMFKSAHELTLMHRANAITLKAYEVVYSQLKLGMTQDNVKSLMKNTMTVLGGSRPWGLALFNEASAYPHGTRQQQKIEHGSIVLMDCGCAVHGYQADISRTFVFGEPNKLQTDVWRAVRKGQQIAFDKAILGMAAGSVDNSVRSYYESLGYGPDYQLPGLSHRTGHGIGMEGHESVNFVRGENTPIQPGMCFSNEPGIYLPGKFGVRLEDCVYITQSGPAWFTSPPDSLAQPLGNVEPLKV